MKQQRSGKLVQIKVLVLAHRATQTQSLTTGWVKTGCGGVHQPKCSCTEKFQLARCCWYHLIEFLISLWRNFTEMKQHVIYDKICPITRPVCKGVFKHTRNSAAFGHIFPCAHWARIRSGSLSFWGKKVERHILFWNIFKTYWCLR